MGELVREHHLHEPDDRRHQRAQHPGDQERRDQWVIELVVVDRMDDVLLERDRDRDEHQDQPEVPADQVGGAP